MELSSFVLPRSAPGDAGAAFTATAAPRQNEESAAAASTRRPRGRALTASAGTETVL